MDKAAANVEEVEVYPDVGAVGDKAPLAELEAWP